MSPDERDEKTPSNIHSEPVKQQHVSHWDRDYLPTEELEARYNTSSEEDGDSPESDSDARDAGD